jgi:hypothetical protein
MQVVLEIKNICGSIDPFNHYLLVLFNYLPSLTYDDFVNTSRSTDREKWDGDDNPGLASDVLQKNITTWENIKAAYSFW